MSVDVFKWVDDFKSEALYIILHILYYFVADLTSLPISSEILSAAAERGCGEGRGRWLKKTQLFDSKKSVNDVKFAPRHVIVHAL